MDNNIQIKRQILAKLYEVRNRLESVRRRQIEDSIAKIEAKNPAYLE